ncbi:hypothetical protein [Leptothermofonsia sp. ETS-13]
MFCAYSPGGINLTQTGVAELSHHSSPDVQIANLKAIVLQFSEIAA